MMILNSYRFGGGAPSGLLLDDYPNAAAAYSLRQLRTGVTNVIRVRESGGNTEADFTPTQITDGTLAAFCGANDGYVVTWYDQSGSSKNATQSTILLQPKIVVSGTLNTLNGKPSILFDASTQCLIAPSTAFGVASVVSVLNRTTTGFLYKWSIDNGNFRHSFRNNNGNEYDIGINGTNYTSSGTAYPINSQLLVYVDYDDPVLGYTNNTIKLNTASATPSATGAININRAAGAFNNLGLIGNTSELIFWGSSQTANRTGIHTEINTYYGVY